MTYVWLSFGAVLGVFGRYYAVSAIQARLGGGFPWGTFTVNLSGSLLLGLLAGLLATHPAWPVTSLQAFFGIGFCATYTTFSSFMFETRQLWREGNRRAALFNLASQPSLGLGCAWLGLWLGTRLG